MIGVIIFLLAWICAVMAAVDLTTYMRGDTTSLVAAWFFSLATIILAIQSAAMEISDAIRKGEEK